MKFTDQQLSAFLDAELPESEMQSIRDALATDETLSNRLAELSMVDQLVRDTYSSIDQQPLPAAVQQLLQKSAADEQRAKVITFPLWRRLGNGLQQNAAIAAGICLALGFVIARVGMDTGNDSWSRVAQLLEQTPSGQQQVLGDGAMLQPRLTFNNAEGDYCRLYRISRDSRIEQSIACRQQGQWQLQSSIFSQGQMQPGSYQTASGNSAADTLLDSVISGEPLDASAEQAAIAGRWQPEKQ